MDPWQQGYKQDRDRRDRERATQGLSPPRGNTVSCFQFIAVVVGAFILLGILTMTCSWALENL